MRFRNSPFDYARGHARATALCGAVAACLALPVMAGEPPASDAQEAATAVATPSAGMRVAVDPATGRVRQMTPQEAAALDALSAARAMQASKAPPRQVTHPDGTVSMQLDESSMVYSVATVGEDGKLHMDCVTGKDHADDAAHGHAHSNQHRGGTSNETK